MSKSRTRIKGRQYESVGKPAEGSLLMGRCLVCELWLLPQDQELSALNKGMQELHRLNMALEDKVPPTSSLSVMQAGWGGSLPKIFRGFLGGVAARIISQVAALEAENAQLRALAMARDGPCTT